MNFSALLLFSALAVLTAWLGSLMFLVLALRERRLRGGQGEVLYSVLLQWSLALFLIVWVKIPTFFATFGVPFVVSEITSFYMVAFIFRIASYILFFRGMMFLVSPKKIWLNIVPLRAFILVAIFTIYLFVSTDLAVSHIGNILRIFHYAVILFLMVSTFFLLRNKSPHFVGIGRMGLLFFMLGWIVFLISDIQIALGYNNLPTDLWFFNLVSSPWASAGFSMAHIFILVGIVLLAKFLRKAGNK